MTFSHEVKTELLSAGGDACCVLAELSAAFAAAGSIEIVRGGMYAELRSEHSAFLQSTADKLLTLTGVSAELYTAKRAKDGARETYVLRTPQAQTRQLLKTLCIMYTDADGYTKLSHRPDRYLIEQDCCAKAYLRGVFLACGSITVPFETAKNTGYHFQLIFAAEEMARAVSELMARFDILPKMTMRAAGHSVYIKESQMICDFLALVGAHSSVLKLQSVIVEREVKNFANRQTNCIIANLDKTVDAAMRQIEAINLIEQTIGLQRLPEKLRHIARLRQEYPDVSLEQIATLSDEPLTKSGINHRMRKIISIADNL